MRKAGNAIASVFESRERDQDRARERVLQTTFWVPASRGGAELIALDAIRAQRAKAQ